ncbi:MAG TPA: hypothetical protein VMS09_09865 [Paenibacillus sp.]|uniref:hypothetical protein n=1 Tax=Paenibacillus sp. TaxID=58172 RepID=UPI0028D2506F|nr:hypothetical protein [Paenibacillus sp.]HUC92322.1 hypothetical protein [Paenibacillus sp.]
MLYPGEEQPAASFEAVREARLELRAGDILTACDNELAVPDGYLGHSAIAVDGDYIVEAVISFPYVQLARTVQFFRAHPKCAVYRPVNPAMGLSAARYAYQYYSFCDYNYKMGLSYPPFSFSSRIPLNDPWTSIYCSKLIWNSYYYGAGYALKNDFGLFTPEDLDTFLTSDPHFVRLYRHPAFMFHVDT